MTSYCQKSSLWMAFYEQKSASLGIDYFVWKTGIR